MADLTDPKDYSHATRGRRELDDYKAAYNSEKQSEAINANTTAIANDVATTKADVAAIKGNTDQVETKLDTLATKLDNVLGRLDNIIELISTPEV